VKVSLVIDLFSSLTGDGDTAVPTVWRCPASEQGAGKPAPTGQSPEREEQQQRF